MSAFFSALSGQRDGIQDHCLMNSRLTSLDYSDFPTSMMYMNPASSAAPAFHPELFSVSSLPGLDHVDGKSTNRKYEMVSFSPQQTDRQLDFALRFSDYGNIVNLDAQLFTKELLHLQSNNDPNLHPEGFSLSLGNQVPSSADMASYENHYVSSGVSSLLSPHVEPAFHRHSQSSDLKTANFFTFDSSASPSNLDVGSLCNQTSVLPKEDPDRIFKERMIVDEMNSSSKYLKAVQELLNELVHVDKYQKPQSGLSLNHQNPTTESPDELSPALRNDMHNKMAELFSLSNEVDKKYKLYCQQMQCVASSFEIMAGGGAARCYTAVALQTISRQFRRLRDAIRQQIQAIRQRLGEQDAGVGLARLKYVDQKAREERSLQQFGVIRQPWRPQRGLPETAVSILRAWLFEHFLHPYPKDSEKIMLARQAGLTRSQVANWFINARVRLWKPMIEEMYKDEFGMEMDFKSSPESPPATKKMKSESVDTTEELFKSFTATVADGSHLGKPNESRNNTSTALESNDYTSNLRYQGGYQELEKITSPSNASWKNEIINITNQHNMTNNQGITSVLDTYHLPELGAAVRDHVSLALGLQYSVNDTLPIFGVTPSGVDDTAIASAGLEKQDYFCIDPISNQDRFFNPHLLSHFVV